MDEKITMHSELSFNEFAEKYQKAPVQEYPNRVLQAVPMPTFSVRVITYQHSNYIRECLDSILMQEVDHSYEIVIGEDQSIDGTREICIEYAEKYPDKIRLFLNDRRNNIESSGKPTGIFNVSYANFMCRGEYTLSCEGDDYWTDPKKIQKQYELMQKYPECNISFHPTMIKVRDSDESWMYKKHKDHHHIFSVSDLILGGGEFCPTNSVMIKGKPKVYAWRMQVPVGDYYIQIIHALNGGALYINEAMSVYRKGITGSWSAGHNTFYDRCRHSILMCKSNRMFDKISGYRFHKFFMKREQYLLKKHGVFKTYDYDKNTIEKVKSLLNEYTTGTLKLKCYSYLLLSFLYYRLKVRRLLELKNRMK